MTRVIDLHGGDQYLIPVELHRGSGIGNVSYNISATPLNVTITPSEFVAKSSGGILSRTDQYSCRSKSCTGNYSFTLDADGVEGIRLLPYSRAFFVNVTARKIRQHSHRSPSRLRFWRSLWRRGHANLLCDRRQKKRVSMKPIVVLTLIAVLFFTALFPAYFPLHPLLIPPPGSPQSLYSECKWSPQAVHDALSSRLQSQYRSYLCDHRRDPVHDALYALKLQGATIQTVTIINQTITGQTASVVVDYFWHYPGIFQINEERQVVEFVNEGGAWKLNTFFPFEGQNILSETTLPSVERSFRQRPQNKN